MLCTFVCVTVGTLACVANKMEYFLSTAVYLIKGSQVQGQCHLREVWQCSGSRLLFGTQPPALNPYRTGGCLPVSEGYQAQDGRDTNCFKMLSELYKPNVFYKEERFLSLLSLFLKKQLFEDNLPIRPDTDCVELNILWYSYVVHFRLQIGHHLESTWPLCDAYPINGRALIDW